MIAKYLWLHSETFLKLQVFKLHFSALGVGCSIPAHMLNSRLMWSKHYSAVGVQWVFCLCPSSAQLGKSAQSNNTLQVVMIQCQKTWCQKALQLSLVRICVSQWFLNPLGDNLTAELPSNLMLSHLHCCFWGTKAISKWPAVPSISLTTLVSQERWQIDARLVIHSLWAGSHISPNDSMPHWEWMAPLRSL